MPRSKGVTTPKAEGYLVRPRLPFEHVTIIPNAWARDERLSFKARGILTWLLSHDAGYSVSIRSLAAQSLEGVASIRAGVQELEAVGYLVREQSRSAGTFDRCIWTLQEPEPVVAGVPELTLEDELEPLEPDLEPDADEENPRSEPLSDNRTTVPDPPRSVDRSVDRSGDNSSPSCDYPTTVNRTTIEVPIVRTPRARTEVTPVRARGALGCGHEAIDDRHCMLGCRPAEAFA